MKTLEWRFIDKSGWGAGPWESEPDKLQWSDPDTGLPCLIRRAPHTGVLCGYVGVSRYHPMYGAREEEVSGFVSVHGGITYAEACEKGEPELGICHVTEPGEPDAWWFGFDCGHGFDVMPAIYCGGRFRRSVAEFEALGMQYRTLDYVRGECTELARQLHNLDPERPIIESKHG